MCSLCKMPASPVSWEKHLSKHRWVVSHSEDGDLPNIWHFFLVGGISVSQKVTNLVFAAFPRLAGQVPGSQIMRLDQQHPHQLGAC